ncbi:MAG: choice-of-anchor I family protein [Epsilonproteobacteria bacterium]|nr:choice-of-anchor I family protein [Campylobacterota bacterium]
MRQNIYAMSLVLSTILWTGCGSSNNTSVQPDNQTSQQTQKSIKAVVNKSTITTGESIDFSVENLSNKESVSTLSWVNEAGKTLSTKEQFNRAFYNEGTYTTTLKTVFNTGETQTNSVTVKVTKQNSTTTNNTNKAPIAQASASAVKITSGENIHFEDTGSYDEDGTILAYEWRDLDGILLSTEKSFDRKLYYLPQYDFKNDGTTTFVKTLTVTDDKGEKSAKSITIEVSRGYEVPTIGSTLPLNALNFPLGKVTFSNGFTLDATWGLGSGAAHKAEDDDKTFYTLTDRGVNIKCADDEEIIGIDICEKGKIFPFPAFSPSIIKYEIDGDNAIVKEVISIKDSYGKPVSGISNPLSTFAENAYNLTGETIAFDPNGLDTEAIAVMSDGSFWLSEEYAPSLIHVSADGKIIERLVPKGLEQELRNADYIVKGALPEIIKLRHANRGIESLAISSDEKTLYFILQSPLDNPDYGDTRNVRLYAMNLTNYNDIKLYNYQLDLPDTFNKDNESKERKQKDVKISELSTLEDGKLMVLERISKTTKLYTIDLSSQTPLDTKYDLLSQAPTFEEETLPSITKKKVFDTDLESGYPSKLEGIAPLSDDQFLLINDNDFGIEGADTVAKIATIDVEKSTYKKQVAGRVVFFDTDGTFKKSVKAGILPDMVTFTNDGSKVLVANEGEPAGDEDLKDVLYDPYGSVSIINTADYSVKHIDFKSITTAPVGSKIKKGAEVARDFEPEYIAVSEDDTMAWVSLQESNAIAKLNLTNNTLESVFGLGFQDFSLPQNALDYKKDDTISIETTPVGVYGMYQPDTIKTVTIAGTPYILTANEGDDRDDFYEETKKASKLDHTLIGDIGKLRVNPDIGDDNDDGDYEKLYAYGTRSFSIRQANGTLVYDSGKSFEERVAADFPTQFNTRDDDGEWDGLDARSEKKGVEPEALATIKIGAKVFAYIGLEKQGGFMVYDITDPANATEVEYNNDIDYNKDSKDSDPANNIDDIGPEGMVTFVQDTKHYLAVANEVSGTTSIYLLAADGKATKQSTYYSGIYDDSAAEIIDYDPTTKRLFVTNAHTNSIDILDISNPTSLTKVSSINLDAYGTGVNSVSVKNGKVAVAMGRKE